MKKIETLKTPCYILNYDILEKNIKNLKEAFNKSWDNNVIVSYSFKTNSLPFLISIMKNNDIWAEVVSESEYQLAHYLGYANKQIVFNGPHKGFTAIKQAMEDKAIINLDSFFEIEWLEKNISYVKSISPIIGLRVNFDLEKECPQETLMGAELGRFGFNIENGEFERALKRLRKLSIPVFGLHFHNSTKTKSLNIFKTLANKAVEIATKHNLKLSYVDIGGGFFGDKPNAPSYEDYAKTITQELLKGFSPSKTKLIIEPGAALAASGFDYLCKILDMKERKNTKVFLSDGSIVHLDMQMGGRKFNYTIIKNTNAPRKNEPHQIVTGFTCMEKDRFALLENQIELKQNDLLLFHNAGAYTLTFVPLFIEYLPNVYLFKNSTYNLVRKKWTVQEYIQKSQRL